MGDSFMAAPGGPFGIDQRCILWVLSARYVPRGLGKLRIASHVCSSYLAVRKATMLTQLALLPSCGVALTN